MGGKINMRNCLRIRQLFVACMVLALMTPCPLLAQSEIPITSDTVTEWGSISPITGNGEARFSKGDQIGKIRAEAEGTIPVINGKSCYFCLKTIEIAADVKVPLTPFFTEVKSQGGSITLKNFSISGPSEPEGAAQFIVAGPQGATLEKKGKGFILLKGSAHLLDVSAKPAKD
jgi:hypothetical protein